MVNITTATATTTATTTTTAAASAASTDSANAAAATLTTTDGNATVSATQCPKAPPKRRLLRPLSTVIRECERRWALQTETEAMAGDVCMQVMAGDMLATGYGGTKDLERAKEWWRRVRDAVRKDEPQIAADMEKRLNGAWDRNRKMMG